MQLRSSPLSPFGRMVLITADILGLSKQIEVLPASVMPPDAELARQNPLGKIPVLILENGQPLYDSRVIIEYLDHLAGGHKVIPSGPARYETLCAQALAIGILEAAVLQVYEKRFRPEEKQHPDWSAAQAAKVSAALTALEQNLPASPGAACDGRPDIGQIALACALGYLDFRFDGAWRQTCPKLVRWLEVFSAVTPAFEATRPG